VRWPRYESEKPWIERKMLSHEAYDLETIKQKRYGKGDDSAKVYSSEGSMMPLRGIIDPQRMKQPWI
jgi:hypothetical protein